MSVLKISLATFVFLLLLVVVLALGFRISKDLKKKRGLPHTYSIQSIKTGKDIRVYNAGIEDGAKIILYPHHEWECITWQFIEVEKNVFLLKNLYTQKSFAPKEIKDGAPLLQEAIGGNDHQFLRFLKQVDGTYLIKLRDVELYLTISSIDDNSEIILKTLQNTDEQKWKLIEQHPII